jgi:hypothetical protein
MTEKQGLFSIAQAGLLANTGQAIADLNNLAWHSGTLNRRDIYGGGVVV